MMAKSAKPLSRERETLPRIFSDSPFPPFVEAERLSLEALRAENAGLRAVIRTCPGCLRFEPDAADPLTCMGTRTWCAQRETGRAGR